MGNSNKPEGSVGGVVGGRLTLISTSFRRRKAEQIMEKIDICSDQNRREVIIGGENDLKRSGVDWRSAEWGSAGRLFNLAVFSVTRGDQLEIGRAHV